MIYDKEDFEIKYWGGDWVSFNDEHVTPQPSGRSLKKKLFITACFMLVIGLTPIVAYGAVNFKLPNTKTLTAVNQDVVEKKTVNQNTIEYKAPEPTAVKKGIQTVEVINNDSYWKITKRTCGAGNSYLSVRDQNNAKALHIGDTVTVDCSI